MKYRLIPGTHLKVSEIGFGVWSLCHGVKSPRDLSQLKHLIRYALDRGINFFDTADTEGSGLGETLLGDALVDDRERVVIATKFGYDALHQDKKDLGEELSQNFTPKYVRVACLESLKRLRTDYIDLYQIYHPHISAIERDDLYAVLQKLQKEGRIVAWGVALGPGSGCVEEGKLLMRLRQAKYVQAVFNLLEQDTARDLFPEIKKKGGAFFARAPYACGWLSRFTSKNQSVSFPDDADIYGKWRFQDVAEKVEKLKFLIRPDRTFAQAALKFVLSDKVVTSVFPDIYDELDLNEAARISEVPDLTTDELTRIVQLYDTDFGVEKKAPEKVNVFGLIK